MAYIIAHGTVNGYNKVFLPAGCGDEIQFITDIRAEFDNTSTMLEKPMGYLIQMTPNGVWISVVKLLFDGERSGNGPGFFAFSAFLPTQQFIEGAKLKQILDGVMTKYLSLLTKEYFTQNIGIDWSIVQQASIEFDLQCKPRTKHVTTNFNPSDKFAYVVALTDEQIVQYLGKPFQSEYGAYKAVFVGTGLQNPNRQSAHSLLNIDVENEVYDIIWIGDTHDYPHIPKTIRKNQIDSHSCVFSKNHYESRDVLLSEGVRDDINNTITIHVPQLEPIVYTLQLLINPKEAVQLIKAASKADGTTISSKDNHSLVFLGEQVEQPWRITIATNEDYRQGVLEEIVPYDYIKENKECGVHLVRIRHIFVQINLEDKPSTREFYRMIQFLNVQRNTIEMGEYDKIKNALEFTIPEDEKFDAYYQISIQKTYCDRYQWKLSSNEDGTWWLITISQKPSLVMQSGSNPPMQSLPKKKKLHVYCPIEITKKGMISYEYPGKSKENLPCLNAKDNYQLYAIEVPIELHRKDITFYDFSGEKLKFDVEGDVYIYIKKSSLVARLAETFKQYWGIALIVTVIILILSLGLFVASYFDIIDVDIDNLFSKNDSIEHRDESSGNDNRTGECHYTTATSDYSQTYIELNQVLEDQKNAWNLDAIKPVVEKAAGANGENTTELKNNDSLAYECMKKLSWLYRTRECINKQDWNALPALVKAENPNFQKKWSIYIDKEKIGFLRELIVPSNANARKKFEKKIKSNKDFNNKTYDEIVTLWESSKQEAKTPAYVSQTPTNPNVNKTANAKGGVDEEAY